MDNLAYVDIYVDEGSWHGIRGTFVLWCDRLHKDTNVAFSYSHKDGALAVSGVDPALAARFRDAWLADAIEEYHEFVKPLRGLN